MIKCFLLEYAGAGQCRDSAGKLYGFDDLPPGAMFLQPVGPGGLACYHQPKCDAHLVVMCPSDPVYMWHVDGPSECAWRGNLSHRCWIRYGSPPDVTVTKGSCPGGAGSISTRPRGQPGRYHGFLYRGVLSDNLIGPACNPWDRLGQQPRPIPDRSDTPVAEIISLLKLSLGDNRVGVLVTANSATSAGDSIEQTSEGPLRLALSALDIVRSAGDSDEDVAEWFTLPNDLLEDVPPIVAISDKWSMPAVRNRVLQAARHFVEQASPKVFDRFLAENNRQET